MPAKDRFEPQDVLTGEDFSFRQNKSMSSAQANETFVVDARFNRNLGEGGETLGFAKKQYSNDLAAQQAREQAQNDLIKRTNNLLKKPVVAKWGEDRVNLEKIDEALARKESSLSQAQAELLKAQNAEIPDEQVMAAKLAEEVRLQREMNDLLSIQANPEQEEARLLAVMTENTDVQEYVKLMDQLPAVKNLCHSINNIAYSSANLYADEGAMDDPNAGGDRALLTRSVASHEVDKLIRLNVCAQEKYAQDAQGNLYGVSVQCDGAGVRSEYGTNKYGEAQSTFLNIDYSRPEIQKGLYDLEALDYITGQIDRHQGNIFIDPVSGKVTGIDNDLAFPAIDREEMLNRSPFLKGKAVEGLPKMMHQETADKIAAMDPVELRRKLESIRPPDGSPGLGTEEINGAVQRLEQLQAAIANPGSVPGGFQVVPEFTTDHYAEAIAAQRKMGEDSGEGNKAPNTSYIGSIENERDFAQSRIDAGDNKYKMRDPKTVQKAKINPEYTAFKAMAPQQQAQYRGLQQEIAQLEDKLTETRKRAQKMEHPSLKDKLVAVKHGGVNGTRLHLMKKESGITEELRKKMDELRAMTPPPPAVEEPKAGGAKVSTRQRMAAMRQDKIHSISDHTVGSEIQASDKKKASGHGVGEDKSSVGAKIPKRQQIKIEGVSSSSVRPGGGIGR